MKMFSREFTRTEKLLIVVLIIVLLGLVYYQFVDKSVRATVENAHSEAQMLETQIDAAQMRAMRLASLQSRLDEMEANGRLSWMSSYNGSKAEVAFLNDVLSDTLSYTVEFTNVSRNGNQIRRSFKLNYTTGGFRAARDIIEQLRNGENRCLVTNVNCSVSTVGTTSVQAQAIFYETMAEGTPDAGLPADAAVANQ